MIEGVVIKDLVTHPDERGFFREIIRTTDDFFREGFGQWSHSLMHAGVVKAWHIHKKQVDWWYAAGGVLRVALHDTRPDSPTRGETMELMMGDGQPARVLRIPPGVAHGCRCLRGPANLFYVTSRVYDPADEGRIPHDDPEIGYDWLEGADFQTSPTRIGRFVARFMPPWPRHVFEGIYKHYRDVPVKGKGYDEENLARERSASTLDALIAARRDRAVPAIFFGEDALLSLLVASIGNRSKAVKIVDFGGGMGLSYIRLKGSLAIDNTVEYHIVEKEIACRMGERLFAGDPQIRFHPALPDDMKEIDIVYINSALQYVEDYKGLLKKLCDYSPGYIFFTRLASGDIPTYATAQVNLPGTIVPYWFINIDEIIGQITGAGYTLLYKSASERKYDQGNFPERYRLNRPCNLLFAKNR